MKYWHKQIDRLHILTPIGCPSSILTLDHHGLAQFCLSKPHTVFTTHGGGQYVGHDLIRYINGVKVAIGGGVAIPVKSERSEYGRSIE